MNTIEYNNINHLHPLGVGVISRKTGSGYMLLAGDRSLNAVLPASLRRDFDKSTRGRHQLGKAIDVDPLAVGDEVRFENIPGGIARIVEVLPRRTILSRRGAQAMPGAQPVEQFIAANTDIVMPVFAAASPPPKWNMLDRYLVAAEAAEIPSIVCITKGDLDGGIEEVEFGEVISDYRRIGYRVIMTSIVSGQGLDELRDALKGKTTVLLGKSGVGKTSLLNALIPGFDLRVGDISRATGKGRHTTSVSELFQANGCMLIDTPGVREFGLWDVAPDEVAGLFPEMREYLGGCQFGQSCSHDEEPGCAVRRAVMGGHISPRRYASYLRLREE